MIPPSTGGGRHRAGRPDRKIGDGKVWVSPVENVIRVRTGERGSDASDVHDVSLLAATPDKSLSAPARED